MRIVLHRGQSAAYRSEARFVLAVAGTGGGKSYMGPSWLAREIQRHPKGRHLVVAPTFGILKQQPIPLLLEHFYNTPFQGIYRPSSSEYLLPDGGVILFRSLDNPHSIQGVPAHSCWADEIGLVGESAWRVIQQRIGFHQARCLCTTTPYEASGWLYDAVKAAKAGSDPSYAHFNWSSIANPHYPEAEYYRAKAELGINLFEMRYDGVLGRTVEDAIYAEFGDENIIDHDIDPKLPLIFSFDWNVNPMCIAVLQCVGRNMHMVDEVVIKPSATTYIALDTLWRRFSGHAAGYVFCGDSTSVHQRNVNAPATALMMLEDDARFKAIGRRMLFGTQNPTVVDRINTLQALVRNGANERRLHVHHKCETAIHHMRTAQYKAGTTDPRKDPDHDRHFCFVAGTRVNTPQGLRRIEDMRPGDEIYSHLGIARVGSVGYTGYRNVSDVTVNGTTLTVTPDHPFAIGDGWSPLRSGTWQLQRISTSTDTSSTSLQSRSATSSQLVPNSGTLVRRRCIGTCGRTTMGLFRLGLSSTTRTETRPITPSRTLSSCLPVSTVGTITRTLTQHYKRSALRGTQVLRERRGIPPMESSLMPLACPGEELANTVVASTTTSGYAKGTNFAEEIVSPATEGSRELTTLTESVSSVMEYSVSIAMRRRHIAPIVALPFTANVICEPAGRQHVYNLSTTDGTYFAEGVLVSNCDALGYASMHFFPIQRVSTMSKISSLVFK